MPGSIAALRYASMLAARAGRKSTFRSVWRSLSVWDLALELTGLRHDVALLEWAWREQGFGVGCEQREPGEA